MNTNEPNKTRLLVVEDEEVVRVALKKYFALRGFAVDSAGELEEAEAMIATSSPYAVVIADLRLAGRSGAEGLELLRFVREHSRSTAVAMLSAYGSAEIVERARELGCETFLQKPKRLAEIADVIQALLERVDV